MGMKLRGDERLDAVRLTLSVGGVDCAYESSSDGCSCILNEEEFTEPQAILRYAGRLTGSYPADSAVAALQVDEILHVLDEVKGKVTVADRKSEELVSIITRYASLIDASLARFQSSSTLLHFDDNLLLHEIALYCWVESVGKMGLEVDFGPYERLLTTISNVKCLSTVKQRTPRLECSTQPTLKLTYFPFPGRAEPVRLALFIGEIDFEDERISGEELERRRSSLPFNQLPVLQVDGEVISQALAILRYAGTLSGLYSPNDFVEAFRIDEVFSLIDEFYSSYTWNASYFEKDHERQMELRKTLAEITLPETLGSLERRVEEWSGVHSVGANLTVADLAIYSLLWTFQSGRIAGVPVSVVSPYENLLRIYRAVLNHPKVLEWGRIAH